MDIFIILNFTSNFESLENRSENSSLVSRQQSKIKDLFIFFKISIFWQYRKIIKYFFFLKSEMRTRKLEIEKKKLRK